MSPTATDRQSQLSRIEMVMLLQSVPLFKYCSAEEVLRIASIARERELHQDEVVYRRNEPASALFCLVDGSVTLRGVEGAQQEVHARETFGVLEILSGRLRDSDAVAVERSVALVIGAEDFFDLLSNNIEIVKALFREILQCSETQQSEGSLR